MSEMVTFSELLLSLICSCLYELSLILFNWAYLPHYNGSVVKTKI